MSVPKWWKQFRAWLVEAAQIDWPESEVYWAELAEIVIPAVGSDPDPLRSAQNGARVLMRRGFPFPGQVHAHLPSAIREFRAGRSPCDPRRPDDRRSPDEEREDSDAKAYWASLSPDVRDRWRAAVRRWMSGGIPFPGGRETFVEMFATAWAYDLMNIPKSVRKSIQPQTPEINDGKDVQESAR